MIYVYFIYLQEGNEEKSTPENADEEDQEEEDEDEDAQSFVTAVDNETQSMKDLRLGHDDDGKTFDIYSN